MKCQKNTQINNMTLEEYKTALRQHDWHYQYSDDGRIYQQGQREASRLSHIANSGDDYKKAYQDALNLFLGN